MWRLLPFLCVSFITTSHAIAQDGNLFYEVEIEAPHEIIEKPYLEPLFTHDQKALILLGRDEERHHFFTIYSRLGAGQDAPSVFNKIDMPPDALFFDFISLGEDQKTQIATLSATGISFLSPENGSAQSFIPVTSIYRLKDNPNFSQLDFARDVNDDGKDDFLIPDFDGHYLFLQTDDGFADPIFLPVAPEMRIGGQAFYQQGVPRYQSFPIYLEDADLDGRSDIIFLKNQQLIYFSQNEDSQFSPTPRFIELPLNVIGNSLGEEMKADENRANGSNFIETRIKNIKDIDGDGVIDILTLTEQAEGTFNRLATQSIHFGQTTDQGLSFNADSDTGVTVKGFSLFEDLVDIEGDDRFEITAASNEIGIRKIIGALLTGSTKFDISIFKLDAERNFPKKPNLVKKLRLDFEFSSGTLSIPVIKLGDITGDGVKELIIDDEKKSLKIFSRLEGDDRLFGKKGIEYDVDLPKAGDQVQIEDIDNNGRDDLLIHFDPFGDDGDKNKRRLILLLSI